MTLNPKYLFEGLHLENLKSCQVSEALTLGEDPNAIGFYKWTALHEAVSNNNPGVCELLSFWFLLLV